MCFVSSDWLLIHLNSANKMKLKTSPNRSEPKVYIFFNYPCWAVYVCLGIIELNCFNIIIEYLSSRKSSATKKFKILSLFFKLILETKWLFPRDSDYYLNKLKKSLKSNFPLLKLGRLYINWNKYFKNGLSFSLISVFKSFLFLIWKRIKIFSEPHENEN